jgi:hypothetical protein
MVATKSLRTSSSTRVAAVAALVLAASSPSPAQNAPAPGAGAVPPTREGNIYDHLDHQPTQAEIDGAEAAAGSGAPATKSQEQVEKEVRALLKRTDELDKQSDKDLTNDSNGGH